MKAKYRHQKSQILQDSKDCYPWSRWIARSSWRDIWHWPSKFLKIRIKVTQGYENRPSLILRRAWFIDSVSVSWLPGIRPWDSCQDAQFSALKKDVLLVFSPSDKDALSIALYITNSEEALSAQIYSAVHIIQISHNSKFKIIPFKFVVLGMVL